MQDKLKNLDLIKHWINRGLCREGSDINYYQNECRFYLDEYLEQEELRNDFLLNYFSLNSEIELADYWLEKRFNERN